MTKWQLDEHTQRWVNELKAEWLAQLALKTLIFAASSTLLVVITVSTIGRGPLSYFLCGGSVASLFVAGALAVRCVMHARDSL